MRKTASEKLADHYLEAAGIAAVCMTDEGEVRLLRIVTTAAAPGCLIVCTSSYGDAVNLARSQMLYGNMSIESRAAKMGIGITAHSDVVARALTAVLIVNNTINAAQCAGEMKSINERFKQERRINPSLRYTDFLHRHKAGMLEAMARENGR